MIEAHWWAIVIAAALFTAAWLFVPEWLDDPEGERSRLPITTLTAAALWFTAGTTASDLTRLTDSGVAMTVDAGVWAYICLAGAAVSVLTFVLFLFDGYPPTYHRVGGMEEQSPAEDMQTVHSDARDTS